VVVVITLIAVVPVTASTVIAKPLNAPRTCSSWGKFLAPAQLSVISIPAKSFAAGQLATILSKAKIRWAVPTFCLLLLLLYPLQAHAMTLASILDKPHKIYRIYQIRLHVLINGKPLTMVLDTGDDISTVTGHFVKELGLDKLPSSHILDKKEQMINVDGHADFLKSVDVKMSIEGSPAFKTGILIAPQHPAQGCLPVLSIHDLIQAYSGIQLRPEVRLMN
jgi:Aspartyl protease